MKKRDNFLSISSELIIERLKFENPWWITGLIDEDINRLKRRLYFDYFFYGVSIESINRAVVLMGPRRVGKTVMLHHTIQELISRGIDIRKICYLNIENPVYINLGLENLFKIIKSAVNDESNSGWYVFFDEIQYLKDWEVHLKVLVDCYPKCRFVVSGSAAAALKLKSNESGAGRFTDFMLPPLTFSEFLHLKDRNHLIIRDMYITKQQIFMNYFKAVDIKELNKEFIEYINYGGYPEVIFSDVIKSNPGRYIRNDIIDKVLLRDLPSLYGIQDVQELNSLFTMLAYNSGNELSLESLSKSSGVEKHLLKKYIEYLEAAFLIKIINRVDENAKKFKRANFFKVYLTNPSLRSAIFTPMEPTDDLFGNMVETAIFSQWFHRQTTPHYYARWQNGEVDITSLNPRTQKPQWAVEIKWSNRYYQEPAKLKSLMNFCIKNKLDKAYVTTLDTEGIIEYQGIKLYFIPSAVYTYTVGQNTFENTVIY